MKDNLEITFAKDKMIILKIMESR